jgi:hypothetical protein
MFIYLDHFSMEKGQLSSWEPMGWSKYKAMLAEIKDLL